MNIWFRNKIGSSAEMRELAGKFTGQLQRGDVVALFGDLGSGKTFFTQAACKFLNTEQEPTSPTFTIMNEYYTSDDLYIYHFDFYRLQGAGELQNLGLEEYFYNDYLCFVEWADKIEKFLPPRRWEIHFSHVADQPEARTLLIQKMDGICEDKK